MEENKIPSPSEKKKFFLFFTYFSVIGSLLGGIGAYIYYLEVGCAKGTCAITSNPWLSIIWGAAMGFLIGDILSPRKTKSTR